MDNITWESLATVAGAGIAAGLIVQFIKVFFRQKISDSGYRMIAAVAGLAVVLLVTLVGTAELSVQLIILAVFVGLQAGLSASQTYETIRYGVDHKVE